MSSPLLSPSSSTPKQQRSTHKVMISMAVSNGGRQISRDHQMVVVGKRDEHPPPLPLVEFTSVVGDSGNSSSTTESSSSTASRYENQKRRDWNTFGQYLRNHRPPLALSRCSGAHVLEFLRYLDQFGKTKVHTQLCPFFGHPNPPAPCPCPLRQAWGSLDALVGRLRAAFEENGGLPEANPFGARAVRLYLREVRDSQAKARGISYEKKKRKRGPAPPSSHSPPLHQLTSGDQNGMASM